jgi:hypothetical protein
MGRKSESNQTLLKRMRRILEVGTMTEPTKGKKQQVATPTLRSVEGRYLTRMRRRKVYVLRLKGYTIREMAAELKTGLHQIVEDLRAIDEALEKNIDISQATRILNETLLEWEALKIWAVDGARASGGNQQIGYLNTAAKINELQARLLQDAGIIRKVADRAPLGGPQPIIHNIVVSPESAKLREIRQKFGVRPADC